MQIRVFEMVPGNIFCFSFTPASVCSASPPLPGTETLFTKDTGMEQERTEEGLDVRGDSAQMCFPSHHCFSP